MCLVALITKWLWLTRNLHTKPPFTLARAFPTAAGGGNAILKLQLRHIPETAKLELFSNLSCFLQQMLILLLWEGRLAVGLLPTAH